MDAIACLSMPDYAWVALCVASLANAVSVFIFAMVIIRLLKPPRYVVPPGLSAQILQTGRGGMGGSGPAPLPWVER